MTDETKQKIRELSQADVPIGERRALYNQLGRRMKHSGLKACLGNSKERFQLLKEFLIDENLLDTEVVSAWMFGFILLTPLKERLWFIYPLRFSESKVWGCGRSLLCEVKPLVRSFTVDISAMPSNPVISRYFPIFGLIAYDPPRESEKKDEDIFEKLPLFEIEQKYATTEAGKNLIWEKI